MTVQLITGGEHFIINPFKQKDAQILVLNI
jgi:hypothetical protein